MNKSTLFKKAHKIAKATVAQVGNYMVAFKLALTNLYKENKMDYQQAVKTILNFGDKTGFKTLTQITWAFEDRYKENKSQIDLAIKTLLSTEFALSNEEVKAIRNDAINRKEISTINSEKDLNAVVKILSEMPQYSVAFEALFKDSCDSLSAKWEKFAKEISKTYDLARTEQAKKDADKIYKCAQFLGAKRLTGTVKQQAWAEKIRADFLCDVSEEQARKVLSNSKYDKASFWIENRDMLEAKKAKRDYSKFTKWYA